jgi:CRISPR-associated endonuclease/helicase Cas3
VTLCLDQFEDYYRAVHQHKPFRWQTRLLERVVASGWPTLLDLPTGSGKTSALDVALFSLALDAMRPALERTVPRRVVLVVDRRVVVSQASRHAEKIERSLRKARSGVLVEVREALRALAPSNEPDAPVLHVAELRGGIARDEAWAKRPDLPLLAASTVDQVGSRLLFRGYGVGVNSASIHAGLLGNDVLLLLDEVHLSEPFRQTLAAIKEFYQSSKSLLPNRWNVVEMSATPGSNHRDVFGLVPDDRRDDVLRVRLEAAKIAALDVVRVRGEEATAQATFADALAERALALVDAGRRRVAVVVNRVNAARRIARTLSERNGIDVDLITGRMRPYDRDRWLKDVQALLTVERSGEGPPRIIVATQCIEAGADFDFDALVTECASLDALRQRFGRLNRQGRRPLVDAVIAIRSDQVSSQDPVYGEALYRTWTWLKSLPLVDFGIDTMDPQVRGLTEAQRRELLSARTDAPILLPIHLDLWSQTSQHPFPEPGLSTFLHGPQRGEPEVAVLWRADLTPDTREEAYAEVLEAVPPASAEALSLPLRVLKAWLDGATADLADVESARFETSESTGNARRALWWSQRRATWMGAGDLEENDLDGVYVLPAELGGLWRGNWDLSAAELVEDVGDEVQWDQRGWRVRRLHSEVLGRPGPGSVLEGEEEDQIAEWLEKIGGTDPTLAWCAEKPWRLIKANGGYILRARRRDTRKPSERQTGAGDEASFIGKAVPLGQHLDDVERWARTLATNVGLPASVVRDLALAGRLHDLGKADRRFQSLLAGGSPISAATGQLLAKSGSDRSDRRAAGRARKRSGYPRGARHELMSLALIADHPSIREEAQDWELVQHLVASHHGWCRPFAPAIDDDDPVEVVVNDGSVELRGVSNHGLASLDFGVADRFWRLQRSYGWWGLAWLEAILRLADHRASEEEERG